MSKPRMPQSLTDWYELGVRVAQRICEKVGCPQSKDYCKGCSFNTIMENMTYHFGMGWIALVRWRVLNFKSNFDNIISQLQNARKEREKDLVRKPSFVV